MTPSNIRASRYFVLEAAHLCKICKQATQVFALAVPPGHEDIEGDSTVELDDNSLGLNSEDFRDWLFAPDQWYQVNGPAMVSSVAALSDTVAHQMKGFTAHYRQDSQRGGHWTNHCEHCGNAVFEGHLYADPASPFAPKDAEAAASIQVHAVDAPFEAFYQMCWSEYYPDKRALFARVAEMDLKTR